MTPKLLFFFIDGIGLGDCNPEINPLLDLFKPLTGVDFCRSRGFDETGNLEYPGGILSGADAVLGVDGVPQSATGQTSIFTGKNAQQQLGCHLTAFPNQELKELILEESVMKYLAAGGVNVTSANMYTKQFFESRVDNPKAVYPASTLTIMASGVPFRFPEDFYAGEAVFADITNELAVSRGYDIPLTSPEQAGGYCAAIFDQHDFVFFEYFMTDVYGHKRKREKLLECVDNINGMVQSLLTAREDVSLLVVSDHGNAEEIQYGSHTMNPVPVLFHSKEDRFFEDFRKIRNIMDIHPFILRMYGISR